jgi:dipeptidyl-peptidase-4
MYALKSKAIMNKSILIALLFLAFSSFAQQKISVDDFTTKNTFAQKSVSGIRWMKDGKFYSTLLGNKISKYNVTSGEIAETLLDAASLPIELTIQEYTLSEDEKKILLLTDYEPIYRRSFKAAYYVYDIPSKSLNKLSAKGKQQYATFSPDASSVAFVRDNNLFVVNLSNLSEEQITTDGKFNFIINGSSDWVYEEEFSFAQAFFWSPDGKKLAYYRFDETNVKEYNLLKWEGGKLYPTDYRYKYPKAGEDNSIIEIWLYDLATKQKVKADIGQEKDIYIPRVQWTQNPNLLSIRRLNRLQNTLDIIHTNATTGESKTILTEKSDTYVDINDDLTYLADGKQFIHGSELKGFYHLYLYTIEGNLLKPLTQGDFEVTEFYGLDEKSKTLYYSSTEASPLERHFYTLSFDGKKKTKFSSTPGTHSISLSRDFQFYIDNFSSAVLPLQVTLYKTKGNEVIKPLEKNETVTKTIQDYNLAVKEFFSFKTTEGTTLNGYMLKPVPFDNSKKYPVLVYQYSGPGSQEAANRWGGGHYYFHQMLTQQGYIVAVVDPRGTGFRGEKFKKLTYKQLGKYELEDHVETAKYLSSLSYVDANRLGIWGWSYGGYMASLAMTKGAGTFKTGVAVAPVTNWRYYDNIYTERFMQRPQENASGYDNNSPTTHASKLTGNFLLIHGTGDDNVHFQNSVALQEGLINAGKQFQSFYYPDKNHGMAPGINSRAHLYKLMAEFLLKNL